MNLRTQPTSQEIKRLLGLKLHPNCGFVAETYRSPSRYRSGRYPKPVLPAKRRVWGVGDAGFEPATSAV
jgi:hypothetical protein